MIRLLVVSLIVALGTLTAPAQEAELKAATNPFDRISRPEQDLARFSNAFASLAAKTKPAVVTISSERLIQARDRQGSPLDDLFGRFFRGPQGPQGPQAPQQPDRAQGLGSGVCVSADGFILTNNHVVENADSIRVSFSDGRDFDEVEVIGTDPDSDLAVLRIKASGLPTLPLGDSSSLREGDWVLALGSPFGLRHTVTFGIVSATGRANVGLADYEDFIQTDAAINPGNSGGALINMNGELVGVNTAIASRTGGYQGVGFAIPSNMAKNIMNQLIDTGHVRRGWLGVSIQDVAPDVAEAMGLESTDGVLVADVLANGPAAKTDIKRGDVIVELDGEPVRTSAELRNRIAAAGPGARIKLRLLRDGRSKTLSITLDERDAGSTGPSSSPPRSLDQLGLAVQPLTEDLAEQLGFKGRQGVLVASVEPGSPAQRKGLRRGDLIEEVDRKGVASVGAFEEALADVGPGGSILLLVRRDESTFYVVLKTPEANK